MDIVLTILAMLALLLLQGFFSGSEIALVHADRLKLQHLANQGHRGAALVLKLFYKPEVLLGTTLVGTNISLVVLTTLGTILMIRFFGEYGDVYAFLVYTPLFLIFGEVVPKSVYQQKADLLAPIIVYPLQFFSWLFYPLVFVFSWVARRVAHLAGVEIAHRELFTNREQIRTVIEMAEQGADIDVFDRDRIMRVTSFAVTTVGQAMIPIAEMTTISNDKTSRDAVRLARQRAHFRLPVYEGEHNQIIGVVGFTLWDLMDPKLIEQPLSELIKPAYYVTAHQLLDELLPVLQQRHDHMAVVVDEFGSAIGMITLEDILEEIVGEVMNVGYTFEGHLPRHKYSIEELEEDVYLMEGRVPITEASAVLDVVLPSLEAHTIGGMVISHLRHIPTEGECVLQSGYRFTVEQTTERGIGKLRVEKSG
ncbi:hemolysin family protein [Sulfuriflexus mobilis]|uniref:hemolysin family protein n=1 Tax=Sulfuriflexus mobilis TaxID=1811807 RepID=UPI000F8379CF|nr:hemolysin family protein [Sulfuriflexus mobilis]